MVVDGEERRGLDEAQWSVCGYFPDSDDVSTSQDRAARPKPTIGNGRVLHGRRHDDVWCRSEHEAKGEGRN